MGEEEKTVEVVETKEGKHVESRISVLRTIPSSSALKGKIPEEEDRVIEVHKFLTTPAEVELTYGKKTQVKRFEPFEVRITVRMPCYKEEVEDCYNFIQSLTEDIMNRELKSIEERETEVTKARKDVKDGPEGEGRKDLY